MIYLFGASGHGLVILDMLHRLNRPVQAFIDDADKPTIFGGIPVIKSNDFDPANGEELIISIGSNSARWTVAQKLAGSSFATAVHPSAILSETATVQPGSVVMAGAILNPYAKVGQHCIINTGATIDHECQLGDFVHISPNATLCGNVKVGDHSWVAAGAVVIPGVTIGERAIVGAGAVVLKDVPDGAVVVGNPAHIKSENKWVM